MRIALLATLALAVACSSKPPAAPLITAPRIWNDRDLQEWANPVAGLGVRPEHISEAEFYAGPAADWVRTYPVYFPGREPDGYWDRLQRLKAEPLVAAGARTGGRLDRERQARLRRDGRAHLSQPGRDTPRNCPFQGRVREDGRSPAT